MGRHAAKGGTAARNTWRRTLLVSSSTRGAALVGNATMSGSPHSLSSNSVRSHLTSLLSLLNGHINGGDHDARYYNVGSQVDDADTLYEQFKAAGAKMDYGPCDQPYGCREFGIQDLDSHDIAFGQDTEAHPYPAG